MPSASLAHSTSTASPNGNPISNVGIIPDIDTRHAKPVVAAKPVATDAPQFTAVDSTHFTSYRGPDSATSLNDPSANVASPAPPAANTDADTALEIAIDTARNEPVAQL